jgi:hypothetical protein
MKRLHLIAALFIFSTSILAQTPTQTIRGKVIDANNHKPLTGATVEVVALKQGTITDEQGNFRLEQIPVNRYQLQVNFIGKKTIILPILLESGKEIVLEIQMEEEQTGLDTLVVKAPRMDVVHPLSTQTLTIEETFRYPATFYDPARMVAIYAGVANFNNQGNAFSVRGNSPNANQWRLEGVEIVNPNHTPNAGTFSDRITQSAGGVNILSAQLLDYSTFLTGAFPAKYANALGGILDMNLRKGNNEQHEFVGQISLIGVDIAAEGPLSKEMGWSYLANYRYSTIGLLSDLGVDVGDEQISFSDFSFNLVAPTKKIGQFTFFGTFGISENIFETERNPELWEENKDRFDIIFDSRTYIVGATHGKTLSKNAFWKTTLAYSELSSNRIANLLDDNLIPQNVERDNITQSKLALHSSVNWKSNERNQWRLGINATDHQFDLTSNDVILATASEGSGGGILLQPYLNWNIRLLPDLDAQVGLTYNYFTLNQSQALEPRLSLNYRLNSSNRLSMAYGLHSQMQLPQIYFSLVNGTNPNINLGFTQSHHIIAGYEHIFSSSLTTRIETYYQRLFNIPISANAKSSFSALNLLEDFVSETLVNEGTGENYGLELSIQKVLLNDYYLVANASFFESTYVGADGVKRNTRFNGNYIFNATAGKEWKWQKKERQMILGINLNATYLGGFRETPIDLEASKSAETTVFIGSEAFTLSQPDYFKTDFRIYYKRNKSKYNTTLALDIQNATNQKNVAFQYFDTVQGEIITKYQLGLIPILTWRIEF